MNKNASKRVLIVEDNSFRARLRSTGTKHYYFSGGQVARCGIRERLGVIDRGLFMNSQQISGVRYY